jgi:hypothetical protein
MVIITDRRPSGYIFIAAIFLILMTKNISLSIDIHTLFLDESDHISHPQKKAHLDSACVVPRYET